MTKQIVSFHSFARATKILNTKNTKSTYSTRSTKKILSLVCEAILTVSYLI